MIFEGNDPNLKIILKFLRINRFIRFVITSFNVIIYIISVTDNNSAILQKTPESLGLYLLVQSNKITRFDPEIIIHKYIFKSLAQ